VKRAPFFKDERLKPVLPVKPLKLQDLPKGKVIIGIWLKIISVILFVTMTGILKAVPHVPVGEMVFFRSLIGLVPIFLFYQWRGELKDAFYTQNLRGHFWRGLTGILSMACIFYSVILLPLPEAIAIGYATPLILVILCAILLKENVRFYRWSAVIAGLIGVLIIIWPRLTVFSVTNLNAATGIGALVALLGAILSAFAHFLMRKLVFTEKTATIVIYFMLTASLLSLVSLPFGWIIPDLPTFLLLCSAGFLGGAAQIFLTATYRYAEPSTVAPFEYVSMIIGLVAGYFIFEEIPTMLMLLGAAIVMASGIFIIYRENQLSRLNKRIELGAKPVSHLP